MGLTYIGTTLHVVKVAVSVSPIKGIFLLYSVCVFRDSNVRKPSSSHAEAVALCMK